MAPDPTLTRAYGKGLALIGVLLERAEVVSVEEFGELLAVFSVTVAESDPDEGDVLALWASDLRDTARDIAASRKAKTIAQRPPSSLRARWS